MAFQLIFPTPLHQNLAELIKDYFLGLPGVDTVLVVNSCARGSAVPESDLDFAVLTKAGITNTERSGIEHLWQAYVQKQPAFLKYRQSNQFAHLHLDVIDGNYVPVNREKGEPVDYFEIEIGNQVCYSVPMGTAGPYYRELQRKWLPYYEERLRLERAAISRAACEYDLDHIPLFVKRELYFHAFDILCKAFQEYLQTLFIVNRIYPIAYNKWIKEQVAGLLNMPDLYQKLSPILSATNIESDELIQKTNMLRELVNSLTTN